MFGDGTKNLDGTGGNFELTITVGGNTIQPDPQTIAFSTAVRAGVWTTEFPVPANAEVVLKAKSPNAGDSDVDVTAYLYQVDKVDVLAWNSVKLATTNPLPNAAADAAGGLVISDAGGFDIDAITPALNTISVIAIDVAGLDGAAMASGFAVPGDAMTLANASIKAATYDATGAFPLAAVDSGATALARTGADSDTLETLSDEIAAVKTVVDDIPTTAEFEARTLAAAAYFDPAADTVARVTLVDTTTTNTDMASGFAVPGDAMALTVAERNAVADAHLDRANGVDTGFTPRQAAKRVLAVVDGTVVPTDNGATTSMVFKDKSAATESTHVITESTGARSVS
jgi:hypothetical protein